MLIKVSERGVNCELTPVTGNKSEMVSHMKWFRFNNPMTLLHGKNQDILPASTYF